MSMHRRRRSLRYAEEPDPRADAFDGGLDLGLFVYREVVEDHDVTWTQGRHEHLLDVGEEGDVINGAVEHRGRTEPVNA